jgi:hypothetical protein
MDAETVYYLDNFALMIRPAKVELVFNGCNTGEHESKEHPQGKAIDFTIVGKPFPPIPHTVGMLYYCRFRGVGVYINQEGFYSFHADTGEHFRQWAKYEDKEGQWHFMGLINDPKVWLG